MNIDDFYELQTAGAISKFCEAKILSTRLCSGIPVGFYEGWKTAIYIHVENGIDKFYFVDGEFPCLLEVERGDFHIIKKLGYTFSELKALVI